MDISQCFLQTQTCTQLYLSIVALKRLVRSYLHTLEYLLQFLLQERFHCYLRAQFQFHLQDR
jgi:hypothetical protein